MFIVVGCIILILSGVAFFSKVAAIVATSVLLLLLFLCLIYSRYIRKKYMVDDNLEDQRYKVLAYERNAIGRAWVNSNPKTWYDFLRARKLTPNFTVIDFITTGTNPVFDEIIEIGAIRFVNGQETDRYFTRLKPTFHIPTEVTDQTSITDHTVADSPTVEDAWLDFLGFIDQKEKLENLVGHQAWLYIKFIIATSKRVGTDIKRLRVFDTLVLTKKYLGIEKVDMETIRKQLNLDPKKTDTLSNCEIIATMYLNAYQQSYSQIASSLM